MKLVLFAALAMVFAAGSGCTAFNKMACHDGCGVGNCAGCADGQCAGGARGIAAPLIAEGHASPYEPLYAGNNVPPQRCGLMSYTNRGPVLPYDHYEPTPPPSAAAVTYPYYTNRGPRDFLANDPRSIGR